MTKNRLYILIFKACFFAFCWVFFLKLSVVQNSGSNLTTCIFKRATSYPCPSCGTTRAVSYLFDGEIIKSILMNPFGILVATIMIVSPVWIMRDWITRKQSFYDFYLKAERFITKKQIAIPLIVLVILNWVWNIFKHL